MEEIHPALCISVEPSAGAFKVNSFSFLLTDFHYTVTQGYRIFSAFDCSHFPYYLCIFTVALIRHLALTLKR